GAEDGDAKRREREPEMPCRGHPSETDRELDQRVHHRDALVAAPAFSAQQKPADHGNVLDPAQLIPATRTPRARPEDRPLLRPADDADVEERADAGSEHERVDKQIGRRAHALSSARRIHVATATLSASTLAEMASATV